MDQLISTIALAALPIIFAITLHEAAHAYAARHFGDTTAYAAGRMSLNPAVHIDPVGTIVLPLLMLLLSNGGLLFGYAKPVPVDFGRLRNPRRDMIWVALAGPAANFVMAIVWALILMIALKTGIEERFVTGMARYGINFNLFILAFNLLPILPLDGGRVLTGLLPVRAAISFARIEPYGMIIVLALAATGLMKYWLLPIRNLFEQLLQVVLIPLQMIF